LVCDLLWKDID